MKKLWIDQLSSGLGDLLPEGLEPENTSGLAPDPGRIKELTMKKLARQSNFLYSTRRFFVLTAYPF